ncbi:MAG: septum formation initiator family protein [Alphaproteobacteria bacterium]|nr:septum formation initiator family protein [Alphaproteobacteria bacterium]
MTGRQGIGSAMELAEQESRLTRELAELQARRAQLSDEVKRLREPSLDLDLLEERARLMLNAAHPDEVILTPPKG